MSPVPDPLGRALGVCLSPNCANATSASQVGALEPVSNTTDRSSSALPAMASNAPQVASGLSSGGPPMPCSQAYSTAAPIWFICSCRAYRVWPARMTVF